MPWLVASLTLLAAYLIGAIPFGYLIARARGVNIFEHGSGNIGATNVGRVLGRPLGFLVFVLDCAKGAGPVLLAMLLGPFFSEPLWTRGYVEVAAGLTAFLGHLFPVYLGFRGGKGVATGAGAVAVLLPMPALVAFGAWTIVLCGWRLMSLASIVAVVVLCAAHLRLPAAWNWMEPRTWFCVVAGLLVIVKHRANISRLYHGTESQLKENIVMQQLTKSLHVCALGMWFGMSVFFTFVVALSLFGALETQGKTTTRESWFPRPPMYADGSTLVDAGKEQGSRAAGYAIGPIFVWYFALQGICGFIGLATALPFAKLPSSLHRWRVNLLIAALAFVLIGWPLEQYVSNLRVPRNQTTEAYLQDRLNEGKAKWMDDARRDFFVWHSVSVVINLLTIVCVTASMAMAGNLSDTSTKGTKEHEEEKKEIPAGGSNPPLAV